MSTFFHFPYKLSNLVLQYRYCLLKRTFQPQCTTQGCHLLNLLHGRPESVTGQTNTDKYIQTKWQSLEQFSISNLACLLICLWEESRAPSTKPHTRDCKVVSVVSYFDCASLMFPNLFWAFKCSKKFKQNVNTKSKC